MVFFEKKISKNVFWEFKIIATEMIGYSIMFAMITNIFIMCVYNISR